MNRVIHGFLLAPFPAALVQSTIVAIWPKPGMGVFEHPLSMFVAICLLFYLIELFLALPVHLAFRKRGPHGIMVHAVAGSLLVLFPITIALGVTVGKGGLSSYAVVYNLAFFGLGGFLAGCVFWRFAIRPA